jgi:hypothetical protein
VRDRDIHDRFEVLVPTLAADVTQLVFSDIVGGGTSASRTVTFSNTTAASVTIPAGGVAIVGSSATQFHLATQPAAEIVVAPGGPVAGAVHFGATAIGPKGATLQVVTSGSEPVSVSLRGLGTKGEQGDLEPSFQWILDTHQIPVRTGDLDPVEPTLDLTPGPNDEVLALYEATANDPALYLDMDFRPGDVQWLRNAFVLHKRTAYEDDPARPRHLLRLWLQMERLADGTPRFPIDGGAPR